jgi:hypothetical protein
MPCITLAVLLVQPLRAEDAAQPGGAAGTSRVEPSVGELLGAGNPIGGTSLCPTPEATWRELMTLVPRGHLIERLGGTSEAAAPIQVEDLGGKFRISVLHRVREYREEGRDCEHRARMASIFAAVIIDPEALIAAATCEHPPCSKRAPEPPVAAPTPALPEPAPTPFLRLDLSPAVFAGMGSDKPSLHWGGALRISLGRGALVPILGAAAMAPADTTVGGVRLREWRVPMDLGIRMVLPGAWVELYGELGVTLALLSEQALDLATWKSQTAIELGGRVGLGARLRRESSITPFIALQAELVPDPPTVFALPQGEAGRTSMVWIGASVGVSWGI